MLKLFVMSIALRENMTLSYKESNLESLDVLLSSDLVQTKKSTLLRAIMQAIYYSCSSRSEKQPVHCIES